MKLTYKDIKDSVHRLCFLEESEYEEYKGALREGVNFAMLEIARQFPLVESFTIEQNYDKGDNGFVSYDMMELTKDVEDNRYLFMGFCSDAPVICLSDENGIEFSDYTVFEDRFLILSKKQKGEFQVFYKKYPKRITETTKEDREIEFKAEIANLVPLLCAWRIFKDDDETKAALYYNEYLRMKSEITVEKQVKKRPVSIGYFEREGVYA